MITEPLFRSDAYLREAEALVRCGNLDAERADLREFIDHGLRNFAAPVDLVRVRSFQDVRELREKGVARFAVVSGLLGEGVEDRPVEVAHETAAAKTAVLLHLVARGLGHLQRGAFPVGHF